MNTGSRHSLNPSARLSVICGLLGIWQCPAAGQGTPSHELKVLWQVPLKSASFGGGAAADVDGDGVLDIAFCTYFNDSKVRVCRGRDGHELWSYEAGTGGGKGDACLDASCRFADVDRDGKLDLIVPVSNTSQVIVFDAATGRQKWTYEAGAGECIDTPPWVGDIDGTLAIVVGTFKARLHVINAADGTLIRTVQIADKGATQTCPLVLDLNGDKVADYIGATFGGDHRVVAADGAAREEAIAYGPDHKPVNPKVRELWHIQTGNSIYHGPAVGDLNGDGRPDFTIGSYDGKVYAFEADGKELWTATPGERYFMGPTAIADLDGDKKPEVIAASEKVTVLKSDGTQLWSVRFDKPGMYWAVTRGASIADLDGDTKPDLALLNGRGLFKVLSAADGHTLFEFDAATVFKGKMEATSSAPIIADFDGDGKLDVFFVVGRADGRDMPNNSGMAICLTGFAGRAKNTDGSPAGWFMHRHDPRNTGNTATPIDAAILGLKSGGGGGGGGGAGTP